MGVRTNNLAHIINQMELDINARSARAMKRMTERVTRDLSQTGVAPKVSPMRIAKTNHGEHMTVKVTHRAVVDVDRAKQFKSTYAKLADQLSNKAKVVRLIK